MEPADVALSHGDHRLKSARIRNSNYFPGYNDQNESGTDSSGMTAPGEIAMRLDLTSG
jgi:hypothetical protein